MLVDNIVYLTMGFGLIFRTKRVSPTGFSTDSYIFYQIAYIACKLISSSCSYSFLCKCIDILPDKTIFCFHYFPIGLIHWKIILYLNNIKLFSEPLFRDMILGIIDSIPSSAIFFL